MWSTRPRTLTLVAVLPLSSFLMTFPETRRLWNVSVVRHALPQL